VFLLHRKKNDPQIHDRREFRSRLKCLLGFHPSNLRLYETAFIHRSASYTLPDGTRINNERLEYLGDAIIDTILSEYLFHLYPEATEGFMTKTRARIVNRERLNRLGISMELEKLLVSNLNSPITPPNLYGNALEALIGALFIDKGYKRTRDFFIGKVLKKHLNLSEVLESVTDYKSMVLEYCQKNRFKLNFIPVAVTAAENSPPLFSIRLEINDRAVAVGEGSTKKEAEQDASMAAWGKIMSENI